eukprot:TRINITY_DN10946_c0_g1_i1.p1 TRINITY_DN10946_c0_g1~~TRINITY_DN10946_c0_g1_i1.p1  ORF type:complete len:384 (+),score=106.29 TRINITY_DN10946_c0_g1_i1:95-1246(+)
MAEEKHESTPAVIFGDAKQGAKQWQEDAFYCFTSTNRKVLVAGIFDGHGGYNGMIASSATRRCVEQYFNENQTTCETWTPEQWTTNLHALFQKMHDSLRDFFLNGGASDIGARPPQPRYVDDKGVVRQSNGDPIHGGTTASLVAAVFYDDGQNVLISANVGDSDAILIPVADTNSWRHLSEDHGPDSESEWQRVHQLDESKHPIKLLFVYDKSNVFKKYACPLIFRPDGTKDPTYVENPWGNGLHPTNVRYDPAVYAVSPAQVSKDTTCIAMTRSIGDFYAHQFGLSYEPSIQVSVLPADQDFVVAVGSDGIWDCWRYEVFSEYISQSLSRAAPEQGTPLQSVTVQAVADSVKKAIESFGLKHYDDASLVLMKVGPSARQLLF